MADFLYALTGWFRNLYALTDDVGGAVRGDVRGAVGDAVFDDVSDDVGGADCVVLTVWVWRCAHRCVCGSLRCRTLGIAGVSLRGTVGPMGELRCSWGRCVVQWESCGASQAGGYREF